MPISNHTEIVEAIILKRLPEIVRHYDRNSERTSRAVSNAVKAIIDIPAAMIVLGSKTPRLAIQVLTYTAHRMMDTSVMNASGARYLLQRSLENVRIPAVVEEFKTKFSKAGERTRAPTIEGLKITLDTRKADRPGLDIQDLSQVKELMAMSRRLGPKPGTETVRKSRDTTPAPALTVMADAEAAKEESRMAQSKSNLECCTPSTGADNLRDACDRADRLVSESVEKLEPKKVMPEFKKDTSPLLDMRPLDTAEIKASCQRAKDIMYGKDGKNGVDAVRAREEAQTTPAQIKENHDKLRDGCFPPVPVSEWSNIHQSKFELDDLVVVVDKASPLYRHTGKVLHVKFADRERPHNLIGGIFVAPGVDPETILWGDLAKNTHHIVYFFEQGLVKYDPMRVHFPEDGVIRGQDSSMVVIDETENPPPINDINARLAPSSLRIAYARALVARMQKLKTEIEVNQRELDRLVPELEVGQVWEDSAGNLDLIIQGAEDTGDKYAMHMQKPFDRDFIGGELSWKHGRVFVGYINEQITAAIKGGTHADSK